MDEFKRDDKVLVLYRYPAIVTDVAEFDDLVRVKFTLSNKTDYYNKSDLTLDTEAEQG